MKKPLLTQALLMCVYIITLPVESNEVIPQTTQHQIRVIQDSFNQNCKTGGIFANLARMFENEQVSTSTENCDSRQVKNKIAKILSDAQIKNLSDSDYRQWHKEIDQKFSKITQQTRQNSVTELHESTGAFTARELKDRQSSSEIVISTVKGYKSLSVE